MAHFGTVVPENTSAMPQHQTEPVSVIIPVFNEREAVLRTLHTIRDTLRTHTIEHEIIAVDDGSSDGSGTILDSVNETGIRVIHHDINRGYGASLKTGIRAARYPLIMITDADGTYPIDRMPDLIAKTAQARMVVGSRHGEHVHDTLTRKIGRGIVRRFAAYVSGGTIHDINSGLRIFRKEDAERFWHLFPEGFSFTSTITVAMLTSGLSVLYIPINYHKRVGASSIKPLKDFVGFMSLVMRLAVYFRPLRVFVPLSAALFVAAWLVMGGSLLFMHQALDSTWAVLLGASLQTLLFGFLADMIVRRFYSS